MSPAPERESGVAVWTIPLFKVHEALRRRAAEFKAGAALRRARRLAGADARMQEAILDVFYAAAWRSVAELSFKAQANSGPRSWVQAANEAPQE